MRTNLNQPTDAALGDAVARPDPGLREAEERALLARALAESGGDWHAYERRVRGIALRCGLRRLGDWLGLSRP